MCSWWICGLTKFGIVLGNIKQASPGKVLLFTDELQALNKEGLELRIANSLKIKKRDHGLAIVSCKNVVPRSYLMRDAGVSKLEEDDIDLSKLELIDFFSFMKGKVRLSPSKALENYNKKFERFVEKNDEGKKKELLKPYIKWVHRSVKKQVGYSRPNISAPMTLKPS